MRRPDEICFKLKSNKTPGARAVAIAIRVYLRYLNAEGLLRRMKYLSLVQLALVRCIVLSASPEFGHRLRTMSQEEEAK